jgi:hypothetical protein
VPHQITARQIETLQHARRCPDSGTGSAAASACRRLVTRRRGESASARSAPQAGHLATPSRSRAAERAPPLRAEAGFQGGLELKRAAALTVESHSWTAGCCGQQRRIEANPIKAKPGELPKQRDQDPTWRSQATFTVGEVERVISRWTEPRILADGDAVRYLAGDRIGQHAGGRTPANPGSCRRWCTATSSGTSPRPRAMPRSTA